MCKRKKIKFSEVKINEQFTLAGQTYVKINKISADIVLGNIRQYLELNTEVEVIREQKKY